MNETIYYFIFKNRKSFKTISCCIKNDYGEIETHEYFSEFLKNEKFTTSYEMIYFYFDKLLQNCQNIYIKRLRCIVNPYDVDTNIIS